jgi:3-hydroxyisobutyrate dehydrogenase-like beta-hydroxyacid dehydrogenase
MRIGFAGLGTMGAGMARNFLKKGFELTVWNRSVGRVGPLAAEGAKVAATPAELAAASDVVVTALADPPAVREVAAGLFEGAKPGLRWIETSTIGRPTILELAAEATRRGVLVLEAPVTGSKNGAEKGTLLAMTGGLPELHESLLPVLQVFCAKAIHVGPLGSAAVMKLIGNTILSFMLEGLAEGAIVGARAGVPLTKILEVVQASGFQSPYWDFKGGQMARRDFDPHFAIDLMRKDQALMLEEAYARRVAMPGLAVIHQITQAAAALGLGGKDIAAQIEALEKISGS